MAATAAVPLAPASQGAVRRAWLAIFMLALLYILSLVDRQIFVLLIGPIKSDFGLSDVQIGLLLGTSFAVVYAFLGVPAGRIADRGNRKLLIFAGVMVWCCSTIASGFATSYAALVALRLGLAAGEAVLTPAAHSMIGDLFPPEKRSLAASIYSAAGLVGAPLAFSGGALVIQGVEQALANGAPTSLKVWQLVLFAVGLPGVILGIIFLFIVREPSRTGAGAGEPVASSALIIRQLLSRKRLYAGLFFGATLASGSSYALNYWAIETLKRDFGWTAVQAGSAFGPMILLAGIAGALVPPWISRQVRVRGRPDAVVLVSLGCALAALVALALGPTQPNPWLRLPLLCVGATGALGAATNIIVAMQEVAPARMRGTFIALLFMSIALFGAGAVPVIVPLVANLLAPLGGQLSQALSLVCVLLSGPSALLLWSARGAYEREAQAGFPTVGAEPR